MEYIAYLIYLIVGCLIYTIYIKHFNVDIVQKYLISGYGTGQFNIKSQTTYEYYIIVFNNGLISKTIHPKMFTSFKIAEGVAHKEFDKRKYKNFSIIQSTSVLKNQTKLSVS